MATIENEDPAQTAFSVQTAPAQTASAFEIRDSDGGIKFKVDAEGDVTANSITAYAVQALNYTSAYSSLQAALDSSRNYGNNDEDNFKGRWGGRTLFHPAGTLEVTGSAFMSSNNSIVGEGKKSSCLSWENDETVYPEGHEREGEGVDGFVLMPSYVDNDWGMVGWWMIRDLGFLGNGPWTGALPWDDVLLKNGISMRDDPYIDPLRPNMITWFDLTISDCLIQKWGKNGIYALSGTEGWGGFNRLVRTSIDETGWYGLLCSGDQRPWSIQDCHFTKFGYKNNAACGMDFFSQFPLTVYNTVCESGISGFGAGIGLNGVHDFVIDSCYFESASYGLTLGGWCGNGTITRTFQYGQAYAIIMQDCINVRVDGMNMQWCGKALLGGGLDGCEVINWGGNNNDFVLEWNTVTAEPKRIENPTKPDSPIPYVIRGGQHTTLLVKTDAGPPTDAVYGGVPGTIVFNSNESKLYIKASATTNDWHQVGLT